MAVLHPPDPDHTNLGLASPLVNSDLCPTAPPDKNVAKVTPAAAPLWMTISPTGTRVRIRIRGKKKDPRALLANGNQKDLYALLTDSYWSGVDVCFKAKQKDPCDLFAIAVLQVGVGAHSRE